MSTGYAESAARDEAVRCVNSRVGSFPSHAQDSRLAGWYVGKTPRMSIDVALASLHEHRDRPQRLGRLVDADINVTVGSIVVGALAPVWCPDDDGLVVDARFQVFACSEEVETAWW